MLNADTIGVVTSSLDDLTDKNLFAYCDNNPIVRRDSSGYVWETVLDIASLAASLGEVVKSPTDPWAWAGLAGDTIDLLPFVTGVGEATRAVITIPNIIWIFVIISPVNVLLRSLLINNLWDTHFNLAKFN